jgi:hypothetical protein
MRRDWDYVAMSDYQADMRESTETALAAIEYTSKRAERAEKILAELVLAAGGKIEIYRNYLGDPMRKIELEQSVNEADNTVVFRAWRC